ncbi:energy-coupling factor transporter transmembrane component T family protein [Georgenia ruanii]|uniref:Energy-coupling factor transporter transmembrane protein EcfT n=1 Tax=Georgenia ruanii TaxID=348442 RepID=A0A7J9URH2_9MICO|nr:energy-coupling factor transporter transmembrane protein EcfT [Georgenia ruanii]
MSAMTAASPTAARAGDQPRRGAAPLLARANPLAKLGAAFALTAAMVLTVDWVSATTALVLELAVLPLTGLTYASLIRRGWPILAAAVLGGWSTALLAEHSGPTVLDLGVVRLSEGSVAAGTAILLRGLAIALPGVLVLACTDPTDLADGLAQRLKVPHRFVLGALAAMRLVGLLAAEWRTLGMARRARGVGTHRGWWGRVGAQLGQGLALLVQAIRRATRLAVTMEARGFGTGPRTWARPSTFSGLDLWVGTAGVVLAAAAVGAAVAAGTWNPIWG